MDFTQLIPLTKGVKMATTYASDDSISWDWESGTEPDFWGILTINV